MQTMRFYPIEYLDDEVTTIFEVDSSTNMLEQVVAVRALGTYTLSMVHLLPKDAVIDEAAEIAYLARRIGGLDSNGRNGSDIKLPHKQPAHNETSLTLSSQEAQCLLNALVYYVGLTRDDLRNLAMLRNYEAVPTRVVEDIMAQEMADDIQYEFCMKPEKIDEPSTLGFAAGLQ